MSITGHLTKEMDKLYNELAQAVNILVPTPGAGEESVLKPVRARVCDVISHIVTSLLWGVHGSATNCFEHICALL